MRRKVLAVCDCEAEYARNLAAWLERRAKLPFDYMVFTQAEKICEYASEHPVELLLVSEDVLCPGVEKLPVGKLVVLSEEDSEEWGGYASIFKYQPCMRILQEVAALYGDREFSAGEKSGGRRKLNIYGVCSPLGRVGKTSFALAAGQFLALHSPTLYLNLEPFAGFEELFACAYERNMGDLFYTIRQGKGNAAVQMAGMVQEVGKLHCLPPVLSPEDIEEPEAEEWSMLLDTVRRESIYENVILDFGAVMGKTLYLLGQCSKIYMPVLSDRISAAKIRQFEEYLAGTGGEEIRDKVRKINLPAPSGSQEGHPWPEGLLYGKFGETVRKIMSREGGG